MSAGTTSGDNGDSVVVLNAGSSSVKFAAYACGAAAANELRRLLHGEIDGTGRSARLLAWDEAGGALPGDDLELQDDTPRGHELGLRLLFQWLERHLPGRRLLAVGHRVVHGGERFVQPLRVTPQLLAELDTLCPLAPLHQPHNLAAIRAVAALEPTLPQVACFDTAFHAEQDWVVQAFALPAAVRAAGVKRYGFHGLSYEYIASVLPQHLGARGDERVIVAHLGNGASLCAMHERRSVATTMGFTALDGLMMGTRCGNLDPGVVLYLQQTMGLDVAAVTRLLYQQSGLLGVSGLSADMRTLLASDSDAAHDAIELYVHRITREIGGLAALLGGLDALVFTAGIGQHSAEIRRRVCAESAWLGIEIDAAANAAGATRIGKPTGRVQVAVIPTDEELMLARHALAVVGSGGSGRSEAAA